MALLPFCSQWTQLLHSFFTGCQIIVIVNIGHSFYTVSAQFLHRVVKLLLLLLLTVDTVSTRVHGVVKSKSPLKCPAQSANEKAGEQIVAKLQNKSKKSSRAQYVQSIQLLDLRVTSPLTVFLKYGQLDFSAIVSFHSLILWSNYYDKTISMIAP